ncbi:MAG: anti-sigma factor antagonist [Solirubrobacteraceae bacterium]|jgi:anti-sigma B factor antagonist|nr:anti-sigma factor antagonist [Solirubrobacteraceae bacterium]
MAPVDLEITPIERDGGRVLELTGTIDLDTVPALRDALAETLEHRDGPVVVDLRKVEFMDSGGLAALLNAQRRFTRADRKLSLIVVPGPVARLLETTRLDTTFALADTPTQALELP